MSVCDRTENITNPKVKEFIKQFIERENFTKCEVVTSGASEKGNNYMGDVNRVKVSGVQSNGAEEETSFVCKTPAQKVDRDIIPLDRFFTIEVFAYNHVIPAFNSLQNKYVTNENEKYKFVQCFKADAEHMKEVIIMEDLISKGYKLMDRKIILDDDHFKLAFKSIANFHALSFALKDQDMEKYKELAEFVDSKPWYSTDMDAYINNSKIRAEMELSDEFCLEKLKAYEKPFPEIFSSSTDEKNAIPYDVLCHGDCWISNLLFKYKDGKPNGVILLDYQIMKRCSPIVDIVHLLFTSTSEEYRRDHYEEIIGFYYECLSSRLAHLNSDVSKCYPFEVYKNQLKRFLPHGLVIAVMFLPLQLSEPADVIDMGELTREDKEEPEVQTFKDPKTKMAFCERIAGVIRDFVKLDVL